MIFSAWLSPTKRQTITNVIVLCGRFVYRNPLLCGVVLSLVSSLYLIHDYGVLNRSALPMMWQLQQGDLSSATAFTHLIAKLSQWFNISAVSAGYGLMVFCHAVIMGLLLAIAKHIFFAKLSRWALIFLLLSHANYNDFRAYIVVEPIFWMLWLLAVYWLLRYYRSHTIAMILMWLVIFLFATQFSVAAWFWLFLFPFGALFWKPWRRKSVAYTLLAYALVVVILLFLPVYQGDTPIAWLISNVVDNPNSLTEILRLNQNNWVEGENTLMAAIFALSGATSLVIIRTLVIFGAVSAALAVYALSNSQYAIVDNNRRRILVYVVLFDLLIAVALFIFDKDSGVLVTFSATLLLFLLAALGLSYVLKKIALARYSRLTVLVIIWCLVAYFASGFIIFGPRQGYIREAGEYSKTTLNLPMYSNDALLLFYAGSPPDNQTPLTALPALQQQRTDFYYALQKNRKRNLPDRLVSETPIATFANRRGDKVIIYRFSDSIKP